jgi:outer membrane lipoprotein-sorting protein
MKARLTLQDISSLIQLRKSDAMYCSGQPTTYKEFVITTTGTFNNALSTLEIWFFDGSKMILGYTILTHDGKDLSLCIRLQALDLIASVP